MSEMRILALVFLIIATCGNDQTVRSFAWVVAIVCLTVLLTVWLAGLVLGMTGA